MLKRALAPFKSIWIMVIYFQNLPVTKMYNFVVVVSISWAYIYSQRKYWHLLWLGETILGFSLHAPNGPKNGLVPPSTLIHRLVYKGLLLPAYVFFIIHRWVVIYHRNEEISWILLFLLQRSACMLHREQSDCIIITSVKLMQEGHSI